MSVRSRLRRLEAAAPRALSDARRAYMRGVIAELNLLQSDPEGRDALARMRELTGRWQRAGPGDRKGFQALPEWAELSARVRDRLRALRAAS